MRSTTLYTPKKQRISLTALIDVVFILLLFFMLTTNFNHWYTVDVSTASATAQPVKEKVVTLLIGQEGQIKLYEKQKTISNYTQVQLVDFKAEDDVLPTVVVLAYETVPLQTILDVMAHLKNIGVKKTSIGHSFSDALFGKTAS
jgi:biopolymer transport protein ExbD